MAQSRMNITARTFDLCSSLINAAQPTSALVQSTQQLLKWLARERIDELSFTKCADIARGLAYPNENGLAIRSSIEEADKRLQGLKGAPLSLVLSGSLGRLMAQDVDFCYMVSTVTSLAAFYGSDRITNVLCSMMLEIYDDINYSDGVHFRYKVQREPIRAVTSKIVESIFINVVNAGHKMGALPQELQHLHVHIVDHLTFAAIIMGIRRTKSDILLVSERFIGDIATWLFYHFDGRLEISVGNRILYAKKLGSNAQAVCIVVQNICSDTDRDTDRCFQQEGSIHVSKATGDGTYTTFLKGANDAGMSSSRPRAHTRRPLYCEDSTLEPTYKPLNATNLTRAERNHVAAVAKQVMSWLLDIPIEPGPSSSFGLTFKARLDNGVHTSLRVRDILRAHPGGLLQKNTGSLQSSAPVFKGIPEEVLSSADNRLSDLEPTTILSCFPITMDLMDSVQSRCTCSVCADRGPLEDVKFGCLRHLAYLELYVLLAHAISDSLGAKDVSTLSQSKDIELAVHTLLSKLLRKQLVEWDDWFTVAACTASGAPMQTFTSDHSGSGASSLVAIQNGCFVAVAPWVSLQRELTLRGCFGLEFFEGNLRGVSEDLALLRCEIGMETRDMATEAERLGSHEILDEDHTEAEISTAIFRLNTPSMYRLMTFVRATPHLRVIDPTQALHGLSNAVFPKCPHTNDVKAHDSTTIQDKLCVYRFDHILADWDKSSGVKDVIQTSQVFADHLKFNVAVGLSVSGLVVRDVASSCLSCAVRDVPDACHQRILRLVQKRLPSFSHRLE